MMLAEDARAEGKPIHSLETVAEQLGALQPATEDELAATVEQGLNDLDSGLARRVIVRLSNAWSASDADDLLHYQDWCECLNTDVERAQLKRLLDDRNPRLAERIDALHTQHGTLLVGVGALHMFGAAGLPALLQARGFKVTRVF